MGRVASFLSQDGLIINRVEFEPSAAARRRELIEARRDAREVVRDARPEAALVTAPPIEPARVTAGLIESED